LRTYNGAVLTTMPFGRIEILPGMPKTAGEVENHQSMVAWTEAVKGCTVCSECTECIVIISDLLSAKTGITWDPNGKLHKV
jgi:hypothetical protein